MFTTTSTTCFQHRYLNEIKKTRQLLILLFVLLSALVTTVANSNNAAATETTATPNAYNKILSPATLPSPNTAKFSTIYAWGHNTKYSTILFDENIIVKGSTLDPLDVKYSENDNLYNEYTIIGIYSYAINKLNTTRTAKILADDFSVDILVGGVGYNFTTVRYVSRVFYDVEFSLKIFGMNV